MPSGMAADQFERKLYVVRKRAESGSPPPTFATRASSICPPSRRERLSTKACCWRHQIGEFYNELLDPATKSALCLVHQRFSTNTFPTWQLAHPFRYLCHNGEINTIRGNINWMNARETVMRIAAFDDIKKIFPDHSARRQRFCRSRQCRRTAHHGRTHIAARDGHADSGSLGR